MTSEGIAIKDSIINLCCQLGGHNVPGWVPKIVQVGRNVLASVVPLNSQCSRIDWIFGDESLDLGHIGLGHVARALPLCLKGGNGEGEQSQGEEEAGCLAFAGRQHILVINIEAKSLGVKAPSYNHQYFFKREESESLGCWLPLPRVFINAGVLLSFLKTEQKTQFHAKAQISKRKCHYSWAKRPRAPSTAYLEGFLLIFLILLPVYFLSDIADLSRPKFSEILPFIVQVLQNTVEKNCFFFAFLAICCFDCVIQIKFSGRTARKQQN